MSQEKPIPPSLENLRHYLEGERIAWADTTLGTDVVLEARRTADDIGYLSFRLVSKEDKDNGLTDTWVDLGSQEYPFTNASTREVIRLPQGTIMRGGISCEHFPQTSVYMAYLGGISVGRDYSFEEILTPDGVYIDSVLVPNVSRIYSFAPEGEYCPPEALANYRRIVSEQKAKDAAEQQQAEAEMDEQIVELVEAVFPEEQAQEILGIVTDFHPEGRYRLGCLVEHAANQGLLDSYLPALKKIVKEEFGYEPPSVRGLPGIPRNDRGWPKLISEIGLLKPPRLNT